jgi:hypothetical protein
MLHPKYLGLVALLEGGLAGAKAPLTSDKCYCNHCSSYDFQLEKRLYPCVVLVLAPLFDYLVPPLTGTVFFLMMKGTRWVANSTVYISTILVASSVTHTSPVLK